MGLKKLLYGIGGVINILRGKVAPSLYIDDIEKHFDRLFDIKDEEEHRVLHELMSDKVHIDVHILKPNDKRNFTVLYTTGMSDLPMTISDDPDDVSWDFKKLNERAELFCILPPDWQLENFPKGTSEEELRNKQWIVQCLKAAARYPHCCKTWLGSGHTLQFSEENEPFAPDTSLSSLIFIHLDSNDFGGKYGDDLSYLRTEDGSYINLLCVIPIYEDEMNFKLDKGSGGLFMRLFGETVTDLSQLMIDPHRENVCLNKSI